LRRSQCVRASATSAKIELLIILLAIVALVIGVLAILDIALSR
jgi:hypothetical protein